MIHRPSHKILACMEKAATTIRSGQVCGGGCIQAYPVKDVSMKNVTHTHTLSLSLSLSQNSHTSQRALTKAKRANKANV